jgi:hypothetical protein
VSGKWLGSCRPRHTPSQLTCDVCRYDAPCRYCELNPDPQFADCNIPQEISDEQIDQEAAELAEVRYAHMAADFCCCTVLLFLEPAWTHSLHVFGHYSSPDQPIHQLDHMLVSVLPACDFWHSLDASVVVAVCPGCGVLCTAHAST